MFLNREQILGRIQGGELVIDPPPSNTSIGEFSVDLRLGTSFTSFKPLPGVVLDPSYSLKPPFNIWHPVTIELGQAYHLQPGETVQAVTLESIVCPPDLAAFLFPRSTLIRFGMICQSDIVQPGFQGKLVLAIHNFGVVTVALNPGLKISKLLFSEIQPEITRAATPYGEQDLRVEIETLQQTLEDRAKHLVIEEEPRPRIRELLSRAMEAEKDVTGKALETLMVTIFRTLMGVCVVSVNPRLKAEELDILLRNDVDIGFWRSLGSPLLVECKNWSGKVGAKEISVLFDKLVSLSPDTKTGILVAPNGVTGDTYHDAMLKIREKRQQGKYLILLDRQDLEQIANGTHASVVIERKYDALFLI